MSTEPVVVTESLGGSALSRAARAGQLGAWYRATPRGAEWTAYAAQVRDSVASDWYERLAPAMAATGAAAERIRRAADGRGIVVTTGQQPGLFGGPLMTLIKALSARALADTLQELTGLPVAPVFWAATDDADFDEAAVISVALDGGVRELRLEQRAPAGTPMSRVPLARADVDSLATWIRDACGSAPHASYLALVMHAYENGGTVGDAYVTALRDLLEPLQIAVVDASHPAVARASEPLLRRAALESESLAGALRERNADIAASGFSPQVEEVAGLSLVFLNTDGTKRRLPLREAASLGALNHGASLSATVLLRPVLERHILPTAGYLGGPGEFAYFAQVSAVANALDVPAPLALPRWSATIIEPRVRRVLDDFGVEPAALADPHALETRVARERLPADTVAAIAALRRDLDADLTALGQRGTGLVSEAVIDGLRRSMEHRVARLDRRFTAAAKRRETDAMRAIATARGSLFPHGVRQERKLAYAPFLARYGPALLERMLDAAHAHARVLVSGEPTLASASAAAPAPV